MVVMKAKKIKFNLPCDVVSEEVPDVDCEFCKRKTIKDSKCRIDNCNNEVSKNCGTYCFQHCNNYCINVRFG